MLKAAPDISTVGASCPFSNAISMTGRSLGGRVGDEVPRLGRIAGVAGAKEVVADLNAELPWCGLAVHLSYTQA